jgi:hypothetical protein
MLYAIVIGKRWGLCRNKREAIRIAKRNNAEVWAGRDVPEVSAWDWPTFRIGATRIHPPIEG